ncbi:ACD11 homolog protein-like protein [Tanacetum coccineum]
MSDARNGNLALGNGSQSQKEFYPCLVMPSTRASMNIGRVFVGWKCSKVRSFFSMVAVDHHSQSSHSPKPITTAPPPSEPLYNHRRHHHHQNATVFTTTDNNRQITDITYWPPLLALTDCPWTMTPAGNTYTRISDLIIAVENICENAVMEAKNAACDIQNSIIEQKQMLAKSAQQHQEVCDLADAAEIYGTLSKVIDCDVKTYIVKSAESHTRKLHRVRQGLDLIRELFQTSCRQRLNNLKGCFSADPYEVSFFLSVLPSDRYAVVPGENAQAGNDGNDASIPEKDVKRMRL